MSTVNLEDSDCDDLTPLSGAAQASGVNQSNAGFRCRSKATETPLSLLQKHVFGDAPRRGFLYYLQFEIDIKLNRSYLSYTLNNSGINTKVVKMDFQIGQVFISVSLPNWGAQFSIKVIAPIGKGHMMKLDVLGDSGAEHQIDAHFVIYERGDANAEESALK